MTDLNFDVHHTVADQMAAASEELQRSLHKWDFYPRSVADEQMIIAHPDGTFIDGALEVWADQHIPPRGDPYLLTTDMKAPRMWGCQHVATITNRNELRVWRIYNVMYEWSRHPHSGRRINGKNGWDRYMDKSGTEWLAAVRTQYPNSKWNLTLEIIEWDASFVVNHPNKGAKLTSRMTWAAVAWISEA